MADRDDRRAVSGATVRRLIDTQFPQWADLPVRRVEQDGWDNHSFRLGTDMKVRLPSASRYAAQVEKENTWLPRLAPHLPLPIPEPIAVGEPDDTFPWRWSVQRWLPGMPATPANIADASEFASSAAGFLYALQRIAVENGPVAGPHNFFRGGSLRVYDSEVRHCIETLHDNIDAAGALAAWDTALATQWHRQPVWIHGDVAASNILITGGRLSAMIDFGNCGIGDPACDLVIAWTLFSGVGRSTFRDQVQADADTWTRARGWALWKALLVVVDDATTPSSKDAARQVVADLIEEHRNI